MLSARQPYPAPDTFSLENLHIFLLVSLASLHLSTVITSSNNCFLQNLSILIQDSNASIMIILIVKIIVRIVRGPRFYRRLLLIDLLGYVNNCTIKGKARNSGASLLRIRSVHNRSHPPINSSLIYTHTYIYRLIEKDPRFSKLCRPRKWATLQRHGEQTMI